jgi:hypothetical protein
MLSFNKLFPPAIISEYKVEKRNTVAKIDKSNEDLIIESLFQQTNKCKGEDGRTYQYIDEEGNYISARVSPYSHNIFDNLEPEIKELVLTLIDKGYLTCSSCQGHPDRKYRFFTIAFNSYQQLTNFKETLQSFNLPIHFKEHDLSDPNCDFKVIYQQNKFANKKLSMKDYDKLSNNYNDIVKYFNMMFFRDYKEYYLLETRIASGSDARNMFEYIMYRPYLSLLYCFRNYYTKKLHNRIINNLREYEDKL